MAILDYSSILNRGISGAGQTALQTQNSLQQLGIGRALLGKQNLELQQAQQAEEANQQAAAINNELDSQAQVLYQSGDASAIAEFSIKNPERGKRILLAQGVVDADGARRTSDRFAGIMTSVNPAETLNQAIVNGEAAGFDMTRSKEMQAKNLPPDEIKRAAGVALASIDGGRFKAIQDASGLNGVDSNFAPQVSAIQTDPETGQKYVAITNRNDGTVKRVDAKDAIGETLTQEQDRVFRAKSLDDARTISKQSFDQLAGLRKSIGTIDEAIAAIGDKAETGYVDKWLPSFRESTQRLENAAQRMGLDVISATTFGALSEGELRLAMDTAMPRNMQPKDLKKWLTERKAAKTKLARELTKMSIQLGKGKTTIAEYLQGNATFGGDISDLSDEDLFK